MRKYGTCGKFNNNDICKAKSNLKKGKKTSFGSKKTNVPGAYFAKVDVPYLIR